MLRRHFSLHIHRHLFKFKLWCSLTLSFLPTSIFTPVFAQLAHTVFSKSRSSMPSHCSQRQRSLTWPVRSCLVVSICLCILSGTRHLPCSWHCSQTGLPAVPSTHLLPLSPGIALAGCSDDFSLPCFA